MATESPNEIVFESVGDASFEPARFRSELDLPAADPSLLADARKAVREELRDSSRWRRLRCDRVSVFSEGGRGTVYALRVGGGLEFDWTWEGATAFRPHAAGDDGGGPVDMADFEDSPVDEASLWSGEVLEVDPDGGRLFVAPADPDSPPIAGAFFVRPFDFLKTLDDVYHGPGFRPLADDLARRLAASLGGLHPVVSRPTPGGLPDLTDWWRHGWAVLWGPPGTGKTYTTGRQVAAALADESERILVVSTTNRATDAAALAVGDAAKVLCPSALEGGILRIGKGASPGAFGRAGLESMLAGTEAEGLRRAESLAKDLPLADSWEERAFARKKLGELRAGVADGSKRLFADPGVRVVIATAFKALDLLAREEVRGTLERGEAPFTTVVVDEAGLVSRAAVAALSMLAARRVVLVGDPKQLAPISRISRVLPTRQKTWLAASGLGHLDRLTLVPPAVRVLTEQRRMHPDVCRVVSDYQYGGVLTTAPETAARASNLPAIFEGEPRAVWYVLDEEGKDLAAIRAERGPGNRSWVREGTLAALAKLLRDPGVRSCRGMFVTPYAAQAKAVAGWLAAEGVPNWESSTVHRQQGAEADLVVFDTVNAGGCQWPYDEWRRLVNVGLSRAREAVVLLASRAEADEPYLRPLIDMLAPRVLVRDGREFKWKAVDSPSDADPVVVPSLDPDTLGGQFARRKLLRPVLSREQQRLANLEPDGRPRLVRGVAGSGKTVVLSNWLAKTAHRLGGDPDARIWAVYANRSLHRLLRESVEAAWKGAGHLFEFPWDRCELLHVRDVLAPLLPAAGLSAESFGFEYDRAAEEYLSRVEGAEPAPRCRALFIDEAQDLGPATLRLLLSLVERSVPEDRNSRSAHIFFDNAQNVYGRKTPKWSDYGLDMRGRSSVMKESFRSTRPVTELAVNVLHRLAPAAELHDHKELLSLGLLGRTERDGEEWLEVRYNHAGGPRPYVRLCDSREEEFAALAADLKRLVTREFVSPADVCLLYNGAWVRERLERELGPRLAKIGVELSVQTNRPFERRPGTLVATTPHSYKGYDAEVVLVPCADNYAGGGGEPLASGLYVAMTRARSVLGVYSTRGAGDAARRINDALERCDRLLRSAPAVDPESGRDGRSELEDVILQTDPQTNP